VGTWDGFMDQRAPLVSIGMPVYNGAPYIRAALDCLLKQDFAHFELVIADNASTDATEAICREYAAKDQRVRYHRHRSNMGAIRNFNAVLGLCSGTYFFWAACHDLWEPAFLSRCVQAFEDNPSAVLTYPQADFVDTDGLQVLRFGAILDTRGLEPIRAFHAVLWAPVRYQVYGLMRTSLLRELGGMGSGFGPDVVLLLKMAVRGAFIEVPEVLFHLRRTEGYGSCAVQMAKLGIPLRRWSGPYLLAQLVAQVMAAARFDTAPFSRFLNTMAAGLETLLIYGWIWRCVTDDWRKQQLKR
jgi:glycosyltransferase involved in cell wall biosynthesis